MRLYLDDIRCPNGDWEIVRSYKEFVAFIEKNGVPEVVSFDHDLAEIHYNPSTQTESFVYEEKTGYDAAKWLFDFCESKGIKRPACFCHSMNQVGKERIMSLINNVR